MQRNGDGPADQLPLEENGDYTREIGYIKFANYATNITNCPTNDNLLNNVWYQPEEVFFIDGVPEEREHAFWVPVDTHYFQLAKNLEVKELISNNYCSVFNCIYIHVYIYNEVRFAFSSILEVQL